MNRVHRKVCVEEPLKAPTHYRVTVAYDGREFYGWQRLRDKPTIQGTLERAIEDAFAERVAVQGAGRTDRGAHAEGQVAGFALAHSAPTSLGLLSGLNARLPEPVRCVAADEVPADFHVRTDAMGKDYEYRISDRPELKGRVWLSKAALDLGAMQSAISNLVGRHDFATFATKPRFKQASTECFIKTATVERDPDAAMTYLRFTGDRFLMHMVRNMVRAVVKVGEGRHPPSHIADVLAAKERSASPGTAPASGLYLIKVHYAPL